MNFLNDNWRILAEMFGLVVTFFGTLKLKKINEKKEGASALESIQKVYDTFSTQTNKKFEELYSEIKSLKEENRDQRGDLRSLQKDNSALHLEVSKLMQENNELKRMVSELKAENEALRRDKANK